MTPQDGLFIYCEREAPGLLAEPLNAVTNLAFLLAAVLAWRALRMSGHAPWRAPDLFALATLTGLIGIGSLTWHTLATPWAALADVLPIHAWISVFLIASLWRLVGLGAVATVTGLIVFQVVSLGLPGLLPPDSLNGSVSYAPAWLVLLGMTAYLWSVAAPVAPRLCSAAVLFTLALVLRTVDMTLCTVWPHGTHFLWHLCNAGVLYLLSTAFPGPDRRASCPSGAGARPEGA